MKLSDDFKPTRLYIKRHTVTGLRYFGKTTGSEQFLTESYYGSGNYWQKHLAIHGKEHVITEWHCLFTNKDDLVEFAEFFSEEMDIVNARDANGKKLWANLKHENGLDGGSPVGTNKGRKQSDFEKHKRSMSLKGIKRPKITEDLRKKLSDAHRGLILGKWTDEQKLKLKGPKSEEHKAKMRKPKEKVTCPHCQKSGGIGAMRRWHFDSCYTNPINKGTSNEII